MAFYRTLFTLEVLSDEQISEDPLTLEDLHEMTTNGSCSGQFLSTWEEEVSPNTMSRLLEDQGSDPDFLLEDVEYDPDARETRPVQFAYLSEDQSWDLRIKEVPTDIRLTDLQRYADTALITDAEKSVVRILLDDPNPETP